MPEITSDERESAKEHAEENFEKQLQDAGENTTEDSQSDE